MKWGVVVAAGGEAPPDLKAATGAPTKALALFGDATSVEHVLEAVRNAGFSACVTVGSEVVRPYVSHGTWAPEVGSAVDNILVGLESLGPLEAVLLLPADAPALTSDSLRQFAEPLVGRARGERWYAAGLAPLEAFAARYPQVPTKSIRLREGRFLSGALYAASPAGLRFGHELFRHARRNRRSQVALVARFGFGNLIRYALGAMTLGRAERTIGQTLEGSVHIDPNCDPASCLDFDDAIDYAALAQILLRKPR